MAHNISTAHQLWLKTPGVKGQKHKDSKMRVVLMPPYKSSNKWDVSKYSNRWDLIDNKMINKIGEL